MISCSVLCYPKSTLKPEKREGKKKHYPPTKTTTTLTPTLPPSTTKKKKSLGKAIKKIKNTHPATTTLGKRNLSPPEAFQLRTLHAATRHSGKYLHLTVSALPGAGPDVSLTQPYVFTSQTTHNNLHVTQAQYNTCKDRHRCVLTSTGRGTISPWLSQHSTRIQEVGQQSPLGQQQSPVGQQSISSTQHTDTGGRTTISAWTTAISCWTTI